MTARTLVVAVGIGLLAAACGSSGERDLFTYTFAAPSDVANLEDGTAVLTQGLLIVAQDTRLCETLESFPPECGGESVVITDLNTDDVVVLQAPSDTGGIAWTTYPLAVSGTLDGATVAEAEVAGPVYEQESNGLRVRLQSTQTPFFPQELRTGEPIWWAIDTTNVTDEVIPLTFTSAQVAEVTISDGDSELYRWSNGKTFTQEVREIGFAPDQTAGATLADAFAVAPGTGYTLSAWVTGIGAEDVVVTVPVDVIGS